MIITALFLLASAPSHVRKVEPAACAALHAQFEKNEKGFSEDHTFWGDLLRSKNEFLSQTDLPIARRQRDEVNQKLVETDREHLESGDRITTLLIANRCSAPTHITSWVTYASK
jgi:hypothetical protein